MRKRLRGAFGIAGLSALILGATIVTGPGTAGAVPNQPPVAVDDAAGAVSSVLVFVDVLANDTDPEGQYLFVTTSLASSTSGGTVDCSSTIQCDYTSATGFVGSDTFTYEVSDGAGGTDTGTVTMTVAANQPPTAVDDDADAFTDFPRTVYVLDNDTDPEGQPLAVASADALSANLGTVDCSSTSYCDYTSAAGFVGTDTFDYVVSDGAGNTDTGTVTMTVQANQPPTAVDDAGSARTGFTAYDIDVLSNDTDPDGQSLTVESFDATSANGGTVDCASTLSCDYTPAAGFVGSDTFNYVVSDGAGGTDTGTVTVSVTVNQPPTAVDDSADVAGGAGNTFTLDVIANDTDPDADSLLVASADPTSSQGGTVSCSGQTCDYVAPGGFIGDDTFEYVVADPYGATDTGLVTLHVIPCASVASAIASPGLVTSESWLECSSFQANGVTSLVPSGMAAGSNPRLLMTSGTVANAAPPNDSAYTTSANGQASRGAYDVSTLRLGLDVPAGASCLSFQLVFGSEEFPEYVGSSFNDGFIAELDTSDWSVAGSTITAPHNFAVDPTNQIISVNSIFFGSVNTNNGTEYDGTTPLITVRTPVTAGAHNLYLSIFDAGDSSLDSGAFVDNLAVGPTPAGGCTAGATTVSNAAVADFDGDGDSDRSVFRGGAWFAEGQTTSFLGLASDIPVPADYDGNGTTDRAVYRDGAWYIDGQPTVFFGLAGDVPVPGDYDGDGDDDRAVFRPSVGGWYVEGLDPVFFGLDGDIPVPGDYDGNGSTDRAVWRPAVGGWYVDGQTTQFLGLSGDIPVPGNYDGDLDTDRGVWRPEVGGWYIDGQATVYVGLAGDVPVPGDYDGNGTTDRGIWRPPVGGWYIDGQATVFLGLNGDIPLPLPQAIYRRFFAFTANNETGLAAEVDFCNLQFPFTMAVSSGQVAGPVYGRIFEAGVTEPAGVPAGVTAQLGWGPSGSDPRTTAGWTWMAASYDSQVGDDDEFAATFTAPGAGSYSYTYRFSLDSGATATYCDTDGAGSNAGLTFDPGQLGVLTVEP